MSKYKLDRNEEVHENTFYCLECPSCKEFNDTYDDPTYSEYYYCDNCRSKIKLVD